MSPVNIIETAKAMQLDIIAITDHNSTLHCALTQQLGKRAGVFVVGGAEVTSREEVHCLALFASDESLTEFQQFLEDHLPYVPNNPDYFGDQVVIDEHEVIIEQVPTLLISALTASLADIEAKVKELNGLFIPAHVDRPSYSLISQLGFIPESLQADALEIHRKTVPAQFRDQYRVDPNLALIKSSDAHMLKDIGRGYTSFQMEEASFAEIGKALAGIAGRKVMAA